MCIEESENNLYCPLLTVLHRLLALGKLLKLRLIIEVKPLSLVETENDVDMVTYNNAHEEGVTVDGNRPLRCLCN